MAKKSSLVTARASSLVKKYEVPANSKVSANTFTLDDKAVTYYNAIMKNYANLNKYFTKVGELYSSCASKAISGDDLKKTLNKISKNCKNQGYYCNERKKQLVDNFKYSKLEKEYNSVLSKINAFKNTTSKSKTETKGIANIAQNTGTSFSQFVAKDESGIIQSANTNLSNHISTWEKIN